MTRDESIQLIYIALKTILTICAAKGVLRSSRDKQIPNFDKGILPRAIAILPCFSAGIAIVRDLA
jgi:hypothetical protein